jgi:hypothetical protein
VYGFKRFGFGLKTYPFRALRLLTHALNWRHALSWVGLTELGFLLLDLLFLPDLYELLCRLFKTNCRTLSEAEICLARQVFGESIRYDLVILDQKAYLGRLKRKDIIYVSGFTINSWGPFNKALLIHELVHVWQYQRLGSVYIPRALRAQRSAMGYNYGGLSALQAAKHLDEFNLEQQADIVMDYYYLSCGERPYWAPEAQALHLTLYETFIQQMRSTD